jgi:hypothetical protein
MKKYGHTFTYAIFAGSEVSEEYFGVLYKGAAFNKIGLNNLLENKLLGKRVRI